MSASPFAMRGIVEGFYGPRWTDDARARMIEHGGRLGLTHYLYAPKNDPLGRDRWREPHLPEEIDAFAETVRLASAAGLELVWGLSPLGLAGDGDVDRVIDKLARLQAGAHVRSFCVLFDDMDRSAPARQADIANRVRAALAARGAVSRFFVVPNEYCGEPEPGGTLAELGLALAPDIDVFWTGPEVCPAAITAAHARAVAGVLGRPVVLWDNYPVNDLDMRFELHLGPITGRDAALGAACAGAFTAAGFLPEAHRIPVATYARWLAAPESYDAERAWREAARDVAGDDADAEALAVLADVTARSPLTKGRELATPTIERLVRARDASLDALAGELARLGDAATRLVFMHNTRMRDEIAPWVERLSLRRRACMHALRAVRREGDVAAERRAAIDALARAGRIFAWVASDFFDDLARDLLRRGAP